VVTSLEADLRESSIHVRRAGLRSCFNTPPDSRLRRAFSCMLPWAVPTQSTAFECMSWTWALSQKKRPVVLLLHRFPELACSWRKVMLPVAGAGLHVVAPDCRRYGRTSRADVRYDDDPRLFATLNGPERLMASAFGYRSVAAVIGHDAGSPLAAW
jgi:pimeloyl-ACP methyl ester carboxylesterase